MKHNSTVNLFQKNVCMIYDYGIKKKLVVCRNLRLKGFEVDTKPHERGSCHDVKLDESLSRTRSTIFELAYCNKWELFVTLTLNPKQYNRTDLKGYQKALTQWLRDYSKKHGIKIEYLLIPELHKDNKSWHMHGFLKGVPINHLTKNDNGYLDWEPYRKKFGFMSLDVIRNHEAVAKYVTKYITKDTSKSVTELNANMYYCSKGLKRKQLIKKGTLETSMPFDFTNDYVSVKWYDSTVPIESFVTSFEIQGPSKPFDIVLNDVKTTYQNNSKELEKRQDDRLYHLFD